jgi:cytochrome c-type biogenesis protein CcmE
MAPKRTTWLAIGALLVAAAALGFIAFGNLGNNLVYYWTPAEMLTAGSKAYGATIRLGGIVQKGSVAWDAGHTELSFRVANDATPTAPSVLVKARETPPQMFREGIGVVVEGTFDKAQVFTSNRLLVNHSNEYRPPKAGEGDRWKDTLSSDTGSTARAK